MKFAIHEVYVNIRTSDIFSFKYYWHTYGRLLCKHCYSIQFFFRSVVQWISNTLYTSKFFVLVFGNQVDLFEIRQTSSQPVHQCSSIQYFTVSCIFFIYLFACFACIMCSRLQHYKLQIDPILLSSPLETNIAIWTHYNCLSLPCSAASSFWCKL